MVSPENRKAVEQAGAGFLGFIFYPKSKRYIGNLEEISKQLLFDTQLPKVGVIVNEEFKTVIDLASKHGLNYIQLHGSESPEFCQKVKEAGFKVIKVFGVGEDFNFKKAEPYTGIADFFLFDTKAITHGGTGRKFNWALLENYKCSTPFFLSGGIRPEDANQIKSISHPKLYGIDLNSGFEEKPGLKNTALLKQFINEIKV